jgi:hypothetical protein
MTTQTETVRPLSAGDVRELCGDIVDWRLSAIVATGGSMADLETALAFINGEDDVMGEERRSLSGPAAQIYELLVAEEEYPEEP